MNAALILIDLQNDYFPGGAMELAGSDRAVANAARVLAHCRESGLPLAHIQHVSLRPGSTFFLPKTQGVEIHSAVAPLAGEPVFEKHFPNSFRETGLLDFLRGNGIQRLVVAGMMTHMCVDATVRAGFDLGFSITVLNDACATRDLSFDGQAIPAAHVHGAFLAALGAVYAEITATDAHLESLRS